MASSSLSPRISLCDVTTSKPKRNWLYDVFPSFSGEDVRVNFLSHLIKELERKLITTFIDNKIDRGQSLDPELKYAIKNSRIAVVVLSKNYASSTWCLNELLEILHCKKEHDQTVIPVFYGLDPSHVRKQTGEFGEIFNKTCKNQTEEVKIQWKEALTNIANTLGYHSGIWGNEAKLIEEIVDNILDKLLITASTDSTDFVGIEDHIAEMSLLLQLNSEKLVKMVGIWGSSGIGKTTIARILYKRLRRHFQGSVFIDKHFISKTLEIYNKGKPDDYNIKLHLQEILLSEILKKEGINVDHLGAVRERLNHWKVLIIIDDLDEQVVLDAMVGQTDWFGYGSRIIVITKDKQFLRAHGINCIYEVGLPSNTQALQMFCRSAFGTDSPPDDFLEIASEVALCAGNLPLGLKVLGSCLRGRQRAEWINRLPGLRNDLDGNIEKTLKVSYDELNNEKDEALFRHIACFFNGEKISDIKLLLNDSGLDIDCALKNLIDKSLIYVREETVEMHLLLQELGKKIVRTQSKKPGEREFLVDPKDICNVLKDNTGTENVLGIALDMDENNEVDIHESAFKQMCCLLFLKFYTKQNKDVRWHLPDGLDYLPSTLRLLSWEKYPLKRMPSGFIPENLVKLQMQESKLVTLWDGIHSLSGLKDIDLQRSKRLTNIPDLSMATNLKTLDLGDCSSLKELPPSIGNLNKLEKLVMSGCSNLETLPPAINLQSLNRLDLKGCSRLKSFPDISTNFVKLILDGTAIDEFPSNLHLENLRLLSMREIKSEKLWEGVQPLTVLMDMVCPSLTVLLLSHIPSLVELPSSFKKLHKLKYLEISNCINLETIPTDINLESLGALDLSGCSRLRSFPNISTNISILYLNRTGIEEVSWWIENFSRLRYLRMNGCNKLRSVSLRISKLKYLDNVDFSDCGALTKASLNDCPSHYKLPVPHEASSSLPDNYLRTASLDFFNCFKLDQEALIQKQLVFCKLMKFSGENVPSSFTHRTIETSPLVISLLHAPLSQRLFKFKVCVVVDCKSVPMTHDKFSTQVGCRFRGRHGNHLDVASPELYFSNLKLGSQLVIFEFSILLNEEKARAAELYHFHSLLIGYLQLRTRQVDLDNNISGLDIEKPPRHKVLYNIREWGIEEPIKNEVSSFTFGSVTRAPKQNAAQGQQFHQKQFMDMFQNNVQVQGNNFGHGNFSPKDHSNNFQEGYQDPIQAQAEASTSFQESNNDMLNNFLLLMGSLKKKAPQGEQFQQKQFVNGFQNNEQAHENHFGQGNFPQKQEQQFNNLQQLRMESLMKKAAQGQQLQQKQFAQGFQNNAQVQGNNFGEGNFPPNMQSNNFQQGYQAPTQAQTEASTSTQESKNDFMVQKLMELSKNAAQGEQFQQMKFVNGFQNNVQAQENHFGQGNFPQKQQFNKVQQSLMESLKKKPAQGQQLQQKQFAQSFQNNAQVQRTDFGQGNFPPNMQFNIFQQGYQAPTQAQASTSTAPQESKTDILLQQLMESQKQIIEGQKQNTEEIKDLNVKVDGIYNDFNGKFEALVEQVRKLEVEVAQTAESVKNQAKAKAKTVCNAASIQEENDYIPIIKKTLKVKDVILQPKRDEPSPRELKRAQTSKLKIKTLPKQENLVKFVVLYFIDGVKFNEFICDTGTNVNVMSKNKADEKGFVYLQPSKLSIEYAESSSAIPHGFLPDVLLQVGNCFFRTDFHIVEMREDKQKPLVLGYEFLAIVGALVDFPNKRISFTKIDKNVFYPAIPIKS